MINTDFDSHYIHGMVRMDGMQHLSVPLITKVEDNLYQGGCKHGILLPDYLDFILSLYPWEKYNLWPHQTRKEVEMYDHGSMPDLDQLHQLADTVNTRRKESTVLVHCQAGLNRSGLVTGLALIKSGMAPKEAIEKLRKRSPLVLCNDTFEKYLLSL